MKTNKYSKLFFIVTFIVVFIFNYCLFSQNKPNETTGILTDIKFSSINGNEHWLRKSQQNIQWARVSGIEPVFYELFIRFQDSTYINNYAVSMNINGNLNQWRGDIDIPFNTKLPASSFLALRAHFKDGSVLRFNSKSFHIDPVTPQLTIISPNGRDVLQGEVKNTLMFNYEGDVKEQGYGGNGDLYSVKLSTDGGRSYHDLGDALWDDAQHRIKTPGLVTCNLWIGFTSLLNGYNSNSCKLKVQAHWGDRIIEDISDNNFTINSAPPPSLDTNYQILNPTFPGDHDIIIGHEYNISFTAGAPIYLSQAHIYLRYIYRSIDRSDEYESYLDSMLYVPTTNGYYSINWIIPDPQRGSPTGTVMVQRCYYQIYLGWRNHGTKYSSKKSGWYPFIQH